MAAIDGIDFSDLADEIENAVRRVAALATGRLQLMREMREIDDRLGLSPKGLAALRWKIVADAEQSATGDPGPKSGRRYAHLKAV